MVITTNKKKWTFANARSVILISIYDNARSSGTPDWNLDQNLHYKSLEIEYTHFLLIWLLEQFPVNWNALVFTPHDSICWQFVQNRYIKSSTHRRLDICLRSESNHWLAHWLVTGCVSSYYVNQCGLFVNWTPGNKYHWNLVSRKYRLKDDVSVNVLTL